MGAGPRVSYERLEFLGDSVLELAVARALYERYPDFSEGPAGEDAGARRLPRELRVGRAGARARPAARRARRAALPAEELERLTRNRNVLAAVLEAALAALFLEHGFEAIEPAVVEAFAERIEYARHGHVDHKTELQEVLARGGSAGDYTVLEAEGPPHDRRSRAPRSIDGEQLGSGAGGRRRTPSRTPPRRRSRGSRRA